MLLSGNHCMAMSHFLGLYPEPSAGVYASTHATGVPAELWVDPDKSLNAHKTMHLQGRRWGGHSGWSKYDSMSTFRSYGCKMGDRAALLRAVPRSHKELLKSTVLVYDAQTEFGRVVCVHAGRSAGRSGVESGWVGGYRAAALLCSHRHGFFLCAPFAFFGLWVVVPHPT